MRYVILLREMNEPVMVIRPTLFTYDYWLSSCACLSSKYRSYLLKLIYFCSHFLTVNNHRYGRCYVKKIIPVPLCTFLEFNTRLEANSARLFQSAFYKCSMALNVMFFLKIVFLMNVVIFHPIGPQ